MPKKQWKLLSQRKLLKHPRLSVYEDKVLLPNGHQTKYLHFGKHTDAACVIPIRGDGKVLVQKEYSYPPDKWLYQFPGGAVEVGESSYQGALRELAEEANFKATLKSIGKFYPDNRRRQDLFYVYVGTNLVPTSATKDIEEEFETYWFSPQQIDEMIARGGMDNYTFLAAWALFRSSDAYPVND